MNAPISPTHLEQPALQTNGRAARQQIVMLDGEAVHIPAWVRDLASFRCWADTDAFPEKTPRICYLAGDIWIDMSREQVFTHNQIKNEFAFTLTALIKAGRLGRYFPDGIFLTNVEADLGCKPDGVFVARDSLEQKRVRLVEGKEEGFLELEGSPDLVLEVVSASSVEKDTVTLRDLYHRAGIREYWLVDARDELRFEILRRTAKGYTSVRKQKGWLKSSVFGKSFQLTRQTDELGNSDFSLLVP